jgi:hypothetical protein
MRYLLLFSILTSVQGTDENLEAIKKLLRSAGDEGYAYRVKGRFERDGEVLPGTILTSRMKIYQSARHGEKILVKGPEGLWKTPEERLGEKTERVDPDAADIVRTLQGAEAPHRILEVLLADVDKGRDSEDRDVDGLMCRRWVLNYRAPALKESLEKMIDKAVEKRQLTRPDEIRWSSSAKGSLRIYVSRKDGRLVRAIDERSVKIAYKVPDQQPDLKTYKTEMEFDFSDAGKAKLQLPKEVKERLEIKEE